MSFRCEICQISIDLFSTLQRYDLGDLIVCIIMHFDAEFCAIGIAFNGGAKHFPKPQCCNRGCTMGDSTSGPNGTVIAMSEFVDILLASRPSLGMNRRSEFCDDQTALCSLLENKLFA